MTQKPVPSEDDNEKDESTESNADATGENDGTYG
jgi:hypothetical protein